MAGGPVFDKAAWLALLRDALTEQVVDVEAIVRRIPGKADRRGFRAFVASMQPGDVLWHWEHIDDRSPLGHHNAGWCIVRDGDVVDGLAN